MDTPEPAAPKPKKKYKDRISIEEIFMAMVTAKENKKEAARLVGMGHGEFCSRIRYNPELNARFGVRALKLRRRHDNERLLKVEGVQPERQDVHGRQLEEMAETQLEAATKTHGRLQSVRDQIENANKAHEMATKPEDQRTSEEKEFIAKHGVDFDNLKLLFNQEIALSQELRAFGETAATINWRYSQIRNAKNKKGQPAPRQRGLGVAPKGSTPVPQPAQPAPEVNGDNGHTSNQV